MERIIIIIGLSVFFTSTLTGQPSTSYKKQLIRYCKANLNVPCEIQEDGFIKKCPVNKAFLSYWQYMFSNLNKMYVEKTTDITKVDTTFLNYFSKPPKDSAIGSYTASLNNLYVNIYCVHNKIVEVTASPSLLDIECCTATNEHGPVNGYLDFRLLKYIKIKIPLQQNWDRYNNPTFGWHYYKNN